LLREKNPSALLQYPQVPGPSLRYGGFNSAMTNDSKSLHFWFGEVWKE